MAEEWRVIPGFENYEVSDQGRVRNRKTGRILKPGRNRGGYAFVNLWKARKPHTRNVHRLVLLAFAGPSELTCNHKNGIRNDNRLENLEYLSMRDNVLHSIRVLKSVNRRGENNGRDKLTDDQVRQIRQLHKQGLGTCIALAEIYNVSRATVSHIVNGRTWRHVK